MDLKNVAAFATLYRDGTNVTKLLKGNMNGVYSDGNFRFSDLKVDGEGRFYIMISLWHGDKFLGYVESKEIIVTATTSARARSQCQGEL